MKTFVFITVLFTSLSCFGQELDCSRFRNGKFTIDDENGSILIERKGKIQTEEIIGKNIKGKLRVTWINDCTYTLKPTRRTRKLSGSGIPSNALLTVHIIEVNSNSCIQKTTSNFFDFTYTSEMKIVD